MPRLPEWLGISEKRWSKKPDEEVRPAKTAWDWLQLAIVPVILAIAAIAFNASQASREREREDARTRKDRLLALETRRDEVLQSYLQQMSELMLDRHLLQSPPGSEISGVARTLTITTLRRLDGKRKGEVVRFLHESNLIRADPGRRYRTAVIDLENADLRHVDLTAAYLGGAALRHVDLRHAVLADALLADADLSESRLQHASFEHAYPLRFV
jgi:uncharacterized protein YjbI with pentapeptide repeats